MNTCKEYDELPPVWKSEVSVLIQKIKGKSHVADTTIEKSPLSSYKFKVTVCKYNSSGSKGWATIGYIRQDMFKGGWKLTYKPRVRKGEKDDAGKTGSYG